MQKIIRKINGVLIRIDEDDAEVCFLNTKNGKNETYNYIVPSRMLLKNGITKPEQPFEFIELERYNKEDKLLEHVFYYKPLCKENDFERTKLKLSDEYQIKLNDLLNNKDI